MDVLRLAETGFEPLESLLAPFGLDVCRVPDDEAIPGSHWGEEEAGLIKHCLYVRCDTPVHSALHEACHWLLMSEQRRQQLHTDAKGTAVEENAVCYLQIILSERIPGMGRERMFSDMDRWGYSFRLGSAKAWFNEDADDAISFLLAREDFRDIVPS